jgi:hypothetical protein
MRIERFTFKPYPNMGLQYNQTSGASQIVPEDILKDLYNIDIPTTISQLHQTLQGPVVSITRVEACLDDQKRQTIKNVTMLFRVSELVDLFLPLLNAPQNLPLQPLEITKLEDLWKYQASSVNQSPLQEEAESNGPQSFS